MHLRVSRLHSNVWLFRRAGVVRLPCSFSAFVSIENESARHVSLWFFPSWLVTDVKNDIDQADHKSEEQKIAEEHQTWKQSVPDLYDLMIEKATTWPSLTCQWLPNVKRWNFEKIYMMYHINHPLLNFHCWCQQRRVHYTRIAYWHKHERRGTKSCHYFAVWFAAQRISGSRWIGVRKDKRKKKE